MKTHVATLAAGLLTLMSGQLALANGNATLKSRMSISFLGLPVANMNNTVRVKGNSYAISGKVKSNRGISLISNSKASFEASGRVSNGRVVPRSHALSYKSSKRNGAIALGFSKGNVTKASVSTSPKRKPKPGRVPLTKSHRKNVLDPISAFVVPVQKSEIGDGRKVCNRTLPVFDGANRYNLKLSYKSSAKARVKGFAGKTITCAVRYQPIAGHRPKRKDTKFMMANRAMEVTLARIGKTNTYGLFGFSVKTSRGTAKGRASMFAVQ